jgi:transcriptional regulator with XRE-family HTH domain
MPTDLREVLGERIRRQRMALGLSQTDFAAKTGIPVQVLSRLEHGRQSIWVERLVELAAALQVSTDYLLGLTDDPAPARRAQRKRSAKDVATLVAAAAEGR